MRFRRGGSDDALGSEEAGFDSLLPLARRMRSRTLPVQMVAQQPFSYGQPKSYDGEFFDIYHKDIEYVYHAFMYSPVSLLSGLYPLPCSSKYLHTTCVTSHPCPPPPKDQFKYLLGNYAARY